jgi:glycine cleavage system transcriptional repressor
MQQLVLSALGPDRPGIVDRLTEALRGYSANLADSRMVNLRGQFAIVVLIELPDDQLHPLCEHLPDIGQQIGLLIQASPITTGAAGVTSATSGGGGVPYRIRTYAMDQAGLVHRITHVLHTAGVNIEELDTRLEHGPHTGTPLFSMDMVVTVPAGVPLKKLRSELEALCDELNCDLDIDPA